MPRYSYSFAYGELSCHDMKPNRIKVVFAEKTDAEEREAFAVAFEMFGVVYRNPEAGSLTILPDKTRVDVLTAQLRKLERDGALTWSGSAH